MAGEYAMFPPEKLTMTAMARERRRERIYAIIDSNVNIFHASFCSPTSRQNNRFGSFEKATKWHVEALQSCESRLIVKKCLSSSSR